MLTPTWETLSASRGRNELPGILLAGWATLPAAERAIGLADAWTGAEAPERSLPAQLGLVGFARLGS
jgi:hypothetical protein